MNRIHPCVERSIPAKHDLAETSLSAMFWPTADAWNALDSDPESSSEDTVNASAASAADVNVLMFASAVAGSRHSSADRKSVV